LKSLLIQSGGRCRVTINSLINKVVTKLFFYEGEKCDFKKNYETYFLDLGGSLSLVSASDFHMVKEYSYVLIFCTIENFEEVSTLVLNLQQTDGIRVGIIPLDQKKKNSQINDYINVDSNKKQFNTLAVMTLDNGTTKLDERTLRLSRGESSVRKISSLIENKYDLVILDGHSDGYRFHLNDGDICHFQHKKTLPSIYPDSISEVSIFNICSGLRPPKQDDHPLGLSLFKDEAVKHLIAPIRVKGASVYESILGFALLKVGATLGEVTFQLNSVLRNAGIDIPEYLLIGHPMKRLSDEQNFYGSLNRLGDNYYRAKSPSKNPIVKIQIKDKKLIEKIVSNQLRIYCPAFDELYYGFTEEQNSIYLMLFSWKDLPETIDIKFYDVDTLFSEVALGNLLQTSVHCLEVMKLSRPVFKKGPVSQISNLIVNANKFIRRSTYDATVLGDWFSKKEKLINLIFEANNLLLENNEKYARIPLTDRYEELFLKKEINLKQSACPYCNGVIRELLIWNEQAQDRKTYTCSKCGVIKDIPSMDTGIRTWVELQGKLTVEIQAVDTRLHSYSLLIKAINDNSDEDIELARSCGTFREAELLNIELDAVKEKYEWIRVLLFIDFKPWYFSIPNPD
jgi:hypothetical protein